MSKKLWLSLAVVVFLCSLVVKFPARVALALAPMPATVKVQQVEGTIWRGTAETVQLNGQFFHGISWQISPLALFTGRLAVDVQLANRNGNPLAGNASLALSFGGMRVENGRFSGDLGRVGRWLEVPDLIPLRGDLVIGIDEYQWGQPVCETLQARAAAFEVSTRIGSQWHALGDYTLNLGCNEQGQAQVSMPTDNMLGLSVAGSFAPGNVNLQVEMLPTRQAPSAIHDLLRLVGQPNSQGRYSFRFQL
ncbi:type II secretion system protein N [Aliidiomarina celeris]|uniref:type II secretion system protein N n=1 Tax=Aliidiomarina celeris TaxID=2249428 RepID=UPI000DE9EDE6|nr:type II secretion system protein N [Aliidiomarina celeris]